MEPLDFLRAVLPSLGHGTYCAVGNRVRREGEKPPKPHHAYVETIEQLESHFHKWGAKGWNTYYGLATYGEAGRKEPLYLRALFLDIDAYTPKEAFTRLHTVLDEEGLLALGAPLCVVSGGGLHAYWPFHEEVSLPEWQPVANNFKRFFATVRDRITIDRTVPADAARILRPPGTLNFKSDPPARVRVVSAGDRFDFQQLADAIAAKLPVEPERPSNVIALPGVRIDSGTTIELDIAKQPQRFFRLIEEKTAQGKGCAQIQFYKDHAQEDGMEPLWRSVISIARFCDDGWDKAVELSQLHPYDNEKLADRWQRLTGPHFCSTFDETNPGVCDGCTHRKNPKFTTPIILATDNSGTSEGGEIELPASSDSASEEPATVKRPDCPKGYEYGRNGGIYVKALVDDDGVIEKNGYPLLSYDLFVIDMLKSPEGHFVYMAALRKDGARFFHIPAEAIPSKDTTLKHLSKEGIIAEFGGNDAALYSYVRACVGQAAPNAALKTPYHYGWQDDGTFAYAGMLFRKGAEPVKVPMLNLENVMDSTRPKGTLQGWQEYMNHAIIKKGLHQQLAVFLLGSAGPLMRYTESAGMTVHCCSKQSGTGKTLSLDLVASVWGAPRKYRIGSGSSANAIKQRLGLLNSLPLVIDEITEQTRKDPEWFASHLLAMTEGKGKERMESGTNRERLNLTSWNTVAVMSSNTRALNFLLNGRKHSSDGELMRLIEFKMAAPLEWTAEERQYRYHLENNHGVAGLVLAQWMVDNEDKLDAWVKQAMVWVRDYLGLHDQERNWTSLLGASLVMARGMAASGVLKLPMDTILAAVKETIEELREEMKATELAPEEVVFDYIRTFYGQFIVVQKIEHDPKVALLKDTGLPFRTRQQELASGRMAVMGRVDVDAIPGHTDYLLPNDLLRKHCGEYGYDLKEVVGKLQHAKNLMVQPDVRPDLLMGTKVGGSGMRTYCLRLRCRNDEVGDAGLPATAAVGAA